MKPGWKTTEFWAAILTGLGIVGVAFGVLTSIEVDTIVAAVTQLVAAVTMLVIAVQPVVAYIKGRAEVKASAEFSG